MSAEPSSLTDDEIRKRIDTDYEFAKQITSGKIVFQNEEPPVPEAPPAAPIASAQPIATITPAPEKTEPEDKLFTLRKSQLGRYRNPNELLKGHGEAQKFINKQKTTIEELNKKIADLQKQAPIVSHETVEPLNPDIYDPEVLTGTVNEIKALKENVKSFESLREELNSLKQEREQEKTKLAERQRIESTFSTLKKIQEETGIRTTKSIDEIDSEWASFIKNLGELSGTDGSSESNMATYNLYVEGVGDDAEELRATAKANGIELPKELDKYSSVQKVYREHARYKELNPKITIKQVINILKESGELEGIEMETVQPKPTPKPQYDPAKIARAMQDRIDAATTLPAETSGTVMSQNLSVEEMTAYLNIPERELNKDPLKRKMVDDILQRLEREGAIKLKKPPKTFR